MSPRMVKFNIGINSITVPKTKQGHGQKCFLMGRKSILATQSIMDFINRTFYILNNQLIDRSILQYLRDRMPLVIKQNRKNKLSKLFQFGMLWEEKGVLRIIKLEYMIQPKDSWVLVSSYNSTFLEIGCIAQW